MTLSTSFLVLVFCVAMIASIAGNILVIMLTNMNNRNRPPQRKGKQL